MKLKEVFCFLAVIWQVAFAQQCTEVANCDSCSNPGPTCSECPPRTVLSNDKLKCLPCGDSCLSCTADANDVTSCEICDPTYIAIDGTCTTCGEGCAMCQLVENNAIKCDSCLVGFGQLTEDKNPLTPCVDCGSNCAACTLDADDTPTCTKCKSFPGFDMQGYFLKNEDKSCKTCGSKASDCKDNGQGVAEISACYKGYVVKTDKSKCLMCPTDCSECSGEELSGKATCTKCVENKGNALQDGACLSCTDSCMACEDESNCGVCKEQFRVDSGSCTSCPAKCRTCSTDDSANDVCEVCNTNYGPKSSDSITCDKCTLTNCDVCKINTDTGDHSCTTCVTGYAVNGDGKCEKCADGCTTCEWSTDHMKCTACATKYVGPLPAVSAKATPSKCIKCTGANCKTCKEDDPSVCTVCDAGYYLDTTCKPQSLPNCKVYTDNKNECTTCEATYIPKDDGTCHQIDKCQTHETAIKCTTCIKGYTPNDAGSACVECTGTDCLTCVNTDADTLAVCSECDVGMVAVNEDDTAGNEKCVDCGISNCDVCEVSDSGKLCTTCAATYTIHNTDLSSTTKGTSCKKCPSNCKECTYNYDNSKAECDDGQCATGYARNADGGCEKCPDFCSVCIIVDGTNTCDVDSCDDGYALSNDKLCEPCPENCATCAYDTDLGGIACTKCNTKYGLVETTGLCSECPNNCDVCIASDENPDVFTCDTCSSGYAKNEIHCAACSAKCVSCKDESGSMICEECDKGYALDSVTKECVICFSNCDKCTSSKGTVKCTDCGEGYSLSADKLSCIVCGDAATENCDVCGDMPTGVNETRAECYNCADGYTLKDQDVLSTCESTSNVDCGSGITVDQPPMCKTCSTNYHVTEEGKCAISCYTCGSFDGFQTVPQADCKIPESANVTEAGYATIEDCLTGTCLAFFYPGEKVIAGCAPEMLEDKPYLCTAEKLTEYCAATATDSRCEQCCKDEDKCNSFVVDLDGVAGDGNAPMVNMLLLLAAAVAAKLASF